MRKRFLLFQILLFFVPFVALAEDVPAVATAASTAPEQAAYTTADSAQPEDPAMKPAPYADFTSLKPVFDEEPLDAEEPIELLRSDVEEIYSEFKGIVALPPGSGASGEYAADKAKESYEKCAELCGNINKLIYSVTDRSVKIYGPVLQAMRDVAYLDAVCLREYAAGNAKHAALWRDLHVKWMSAVEERYAAMEETAVIPR